MTPDWGLYSPGSGIGIRTPNLGGFLDSESNGQPFSYGKMLQPTESHWLGPNIILNNEIKNNNNKR